MSTTREEWLALAERIEKATEPNREIDKAIVAALGYSWRGMAYWDNATSTKTLPGAVLYTGSLDDITALIERELPAAWVWTLGQNIHHRTWGVSINNLNDEGAPYSVCWGQSKHKPALALCAAFCRAMAERVPKTRKMEVRRNDATY